MNSNYLVILWTFTLVSLAGCSAGPETKEESSSAPPEAAPTFYKDVSPVLQQQCVSCHNDDGIAPFALTDAATAVRMAPAIAAATKARLMPPMPVNNDGSCNTYKNARWLSDEEIDLLQRWADRGALLGDPASASVATAPAAQALTGDLVNFDLGGEYSPHSDGDQADDYRCFVVDPGLDDDAFITAYDIVPGDTRVVHHVALFAIEDDDKALADARALDEAEDGLGYTCFGAPGLTSISLLGGWTPGSGATLLPSGTGMRLAAGQHLILQVHYNLPATGGTFSDRSRVKFQISRDAKLDPAYFLPIGASQSAISLAPGQAHVEATSGPVPLSKLRDHFRLPASQGFRVWGIYPHMHTAGRTLRSVAIAGDGSERCLDAVDRWDFHWQGTWWHETPIDVGSDSAIRVTCGYDTQDRTQTTVGGEGTNDEMCTNPFFVTLY